jgi:formylglycine-generating enzyme required for sulfatase activity
MAFDIKEWKTDIGTWWRDRGADYQAAAARLGVRTGYGLIALSALLPLIPALAEDPFTVGVALSSLVGGVGANLIAEMVQRTRDKATKGQGLEAEITGSPELRETLDKLLAELEVIPTVRENLGEQWIGFVAGLQKELAELGGFPGLQASIKAETIITGGGAVVAGPVQVKQGDFVGRNKNIYYGQSRPLPDGDLEQAYLAHLKGLCETLQLGAIDPEYGDPSGKSAMTLAQVYTSLDTTTLEREKGETQLLDMARGEKVWRVSAQAVVDGNDRVLMLGDPGSGKSTFVNHLALRLAGARLEQEKDWLSDLDPWRHGPLLPLRIILRDFDDWLSDDVPKGTAQLLADYISHLLEEWGIAEYWDTLRRVLLARDQVVVVLLDGLDEVDAARRKAVVEAVDDFARTHPHNRYLVTCRVYAYLSEREWELPGFATYTLAPFNEEQIDHFVGAWYAELARLRRMETGEAETRAARLRQAVRQPDLRGLAERPLLLTTMALLHTYRGQLPEDRVDLYRQTVDLLLSRWEQKIGGEQSLMEMLDLPGLKFSDLELGLYEVAYRAHAVQGSRADRDTADVRAADLRDWLAPYLGGSFDRAERFVRYIRERAGLLVRRQEAVYTFPHRTFQEYLAGCHLALHHDFPRQAARLVRKAPDLWRVVYVLAVGQAARDKRLGLAIAAVNALCPEDCRPGGAVPEVDWRTATLAGEALLEIGLVGVQREREGQAILRRIQGWLTALLETGALTAQERAEAGDVLARLGDPRFDPQALSLPCEPLLGFIQVPPGPFWMGSRKGKEEWENELGHTAPVDISYPYYMARYPVTVAQYAEFVAAGGYEKPGYWTPTGWAWRRGGYDSQAPDYLQDWLKQRPPEKRDRPFRWNEQQERRNHPVVRVSWFEATAYCRWLTEQLCTRDILAEPLRTLLREKGYIVRLPTEAEWEKAARGDDERQWPWGNEFQPERCNSSESDMGGTTPVGIYPAGASPHGGLDMAGNVWEWTHTLFRDYPYRAGDGREDPEAEGSRVLRGGSWYYNLGFARCAYRFGNHPDYFYYDFGFRVVVVPVSPAF